MGAGSAQTASLGWVGGEVGGWVGGGLVWSAGRYDWPQHTAIMSSIPVQDHRNASWSSGLVLSVSPYRPGEGGGLHDGGDIVRPQTKDRQIGIYLV